MSRKVNRNLVALGSAAIISIYAVGFVHTANPAANADSELESIPAAAVATPPLDAATAIAQAIGSARDTPRSPQAGTAVEQAAPVPGQAAVYRDGSFHGTGRSHAGDVSVTVTIQGGQITAVRITGATTHYSTSRIARLPGDVITTQRADVQLVSGATYSSAAFKQAVTRALAQAAAGTPAASGAQG